MGEQLGLIAQSIQRAGRLVDADNGAVVMECGAALRAWQHHTSRPAFKRGLAPSIVISRQFEVVDGKW